MIIIAIYAWFMLTLGRFTGTFTCIHAVEEPDDLKLFVSQFISSYICKSSFLC